jgi:hypothetical protein
LFAPKADTAATRERNTTAMLRVSNVMQFCLSFKLYSGTSHSRLHY